MRQFLPPHGLQIELPALILRDGIAQQPGAGFQAVIQVADEEVVHICQVEAVIAVVLVLLQGNDIVHGVLGFRLSEVVATEDVQAHLVEVAVEAIAHFRDLALQDAAQGQGHAPILQSSRARDG